MANRHTGEVRRGGKFGAATSKVGVLSCVYKTKERMNLD